MKIEDLDLNLIVVFDAIYTCENISRAAESLNLSQPAMSNALRRLRDQIGDPLFTRSKTGVVPTTRAKELIRPVRGALKLLRSAVDVKEFDPSTAARTFELLISDALEPILLPQLVKATLQGNVVYRLTSPNEVSVEDAFQSGLVDLAVYMLPSSPDYLRLEEICPVDVQVIARKGHPRINRRASQADLKAEKQVGLNLRSGRQATSHRIDFYRRSGIEPVALVNTTTSLVRTVAGSDAIGFIPRVYLDHALKTYDVAHIETQIPKNTQSFYMIWNENTDHDPAMTWLRSTIRDLTKDAFLASGGVF